MLASSMPPPSPSAVTSTPSSRVRTTPGRSATSKSSSAPERPPPASGTGKTLGRTVAICGRENGVRIDAMMLPPKAGRVCTNWPSGLISRRVQSAVRPSFSRAATRGARSRPLVVAPSRKMFGLRAATMAEITVA